MLSELKLEFEKVTNPFKDDDEDDNVYEDNMMNIMVLNPRKQIDSLLRDYNMYLMYTNFPISEPIYKMLNMFPGIETLDIITPYRAKISIGKLFTDDEVLAGIRRAISVHFRVIQDQLSQVFTGQEDTSK